MEYFFLGLGNPDGYEGTRHNVGKDVVISFVKEAGVSWQKVTNGKVATVPLGDALITFCVSNGSMNETGKDLHGVLCDIRPSLLVVLHDEIDLPLGTLRLSKGKNDAGHRGVASIIKELGTKDFFRLRIGVGCGADIKRHVLEHMPPEEMHTLVQAMQASLPDILFDLLQRRL